MNITKVNISKDKFLLLSEDTQKFFLYLGHISNEINLFSKLLFWSGMDKTDETESNGQDSQIWMLLQILAGKLYEAWELYRNVFYGCKISQLLASNLDSAVREDLTNLKKYFTKNNNSIKRIRNHFAFHYSHKSIDPILPEGTSYSLYLQEDVRNELFYFSEEILINSLMTTLELVNSIDSRKALVSEVLNIAALFSNLTDGLMTAIVKQNGIDGSINGIHIENLYSFNEIFIPWFTNTDKSE